LYDIDFTDSDNGIIVGWNGLILKTENGGIDWKKVESNTNKYLRSVSLSNGDGVACGGSGDILFSSNNGESWQIIKTGFVGSLSGIKFLDKKNILGVGTKGRLIFSNNGGKNFKIVTTKTFVNFTKLYKNKNGTVFISGQNGTLLRLN